MLFLFLAFSLPLMAYFVTSDGSFDYRGIAFPGSDRGLERPERPDLERPERSEPELPERPEPELPERPEPELPERPEPERPEPKPDDPSRDRERGFVSCESDGDCRNEPPYEICSMRNIGFGSVCLRGDINNDGEINMQDFVEFREDFASFREGGWNDSFVRSDLNMDGRLSMIDYAILVRSYRLLQALDRIDGESRPEPERPERSEPDLQP